MPTRLKLINKKIYVCNDKGDEDRIDLIKFDMKEQEFIFCVIDEDGFPVAPVFGIPCDFIKRGFPEVYLHLHDLS